MNPPAPRLVMDGIWKSFGGVPVLKDVSIELSPGQVLALLGQNGAGKSTLIKILSGEYARDHGSIMIDGRDMNFSEPADAISAGVRVIPQEVSSIPEMTVAENVFIGQLPVRRVGGLALIDRQRMLREARALLEQLGVHVDPRQQVKSLSVPEQRAVEIARALASDARILVMDEPSASLTDKEVEHLFEVIRRLKQRGVSVIYISHYLSEIFEISDRVVVLRDGAKTGEFETRTAKSGEVVLAMLGATVENLYPDEAGARQGVALEVRGLSVGRRVKDVSFEVYKGEVLGLFGLIGSGIGVVGKALFGAEGGLRHGECRLEGEHYSPRSPTDAKALGVGYLAAERKAEGIVPEMSVRENMTLSFLEHHVKFGVVSRSSERVYVTKRMDALGIRARGQDQKIRTLSGGNQQKVCISRWMVEGMKLLIMDEPTRGVDVGARKEIYRELRELARSGLAILLISSDVEEIEGMCDRAIVLNRGQVVGAYERGVSTQELMDVATQANAA